MIKAPAKDEPPGRPEIRMGFVHDGAMCWGFFAYHLLIQAKQAGVHLTVRPATTMSEQIAEVESFVQENVDVLMFRPIATDDPGLLAILRRAQASGIHLISIDGQPGGGFDVCSVTADNFGGQAALAEFVFRKLKRRARVAYLQGDPRSDAGTLRNRGLHSVLRRYPQVELVFSEAMSWSSPNSNFEQGVDMAQRVVRAHPELDAIICATDECALGVISVLEKSGLRGTIIVAGFDGLPEGITALNAGDFEVTARQPLDTMASLTFDLAMRLHKGEIRTIVHYVQDVELVTQANLGVEALRALRVFPGITADLDRRTTEQKSSAAFLEALFDVMPTLVLVKDARDLRYIRANKARDEWLNVPRGSQAGKYVEDFCSPDVSAKHNAEERGVLERRQTLELPEEEFALPGSDVRYMRTRKIPIFDAKGDPEYLMVISEDITHQKLTQRALTERAIELERTRLALKKNAEKLAQAEQLASLGALVAGVSHELNTPIGNALLAVTTFSDHTCGIAAKAETGLTRTALEDYLNDAAAGVEILVRNVHRSAELIQSFKQVAVDQTLSQARTFNLATVVDDMLLTVSHLQKRTHWVIERDIPADLILDSFPGPLEQVLMNLINNAVVHAFEGRENGRIVIAARLAQPGWVEITVSDNGVGIDPDRIKRIFDPFFSTKFGQGGSGLGLSISSNIVTRRLGGQIDVTSQPGEGARFHLLIPIQAPNEHG